MDTKRRRYFDVVRPGSVPTSATSRPVIVGHRSPVRDPMIQRRGAAGLRANTPAAQKPTLPSLANRPKPPRAPTGHHDPKRSAPSMARRGGSTAPVVDQILAPETATNGPSINLSHNHAKSSKPVFAKDPVNNQQVSDQYYYASTDRRIGRRLMMGGLIVLVALALALNVYLLINYLG